MDGWSSTTDHWPSGMVFYFILNSFLYTLEEYGPGVLNYSLFPVDAVVI